MGYAHNDSSRLAPHATLQSNLKWRAAQLRPSYETTAETLRHEARGYLEEQANILRQEGFRNVKCIVQEGDAGAEIIDVAHKTKENLVAMCSHGRSGIARWVLGGTTDRVVRYSEDPVLVIRSSVRGRKI